MFNTGINEELDLITHQEQVPVHVLQVSTVPTTRYLYRCVKLQPLMSTLQFLSKNASLTKNVRMIDMLPSHWVWSPKYKHILSLVNINNGNTIYLQRF